MTGPISDSPQTRRRTDVVVKTKQIPSSALSDVGLHEDITGINARANPTSTDTVFSTFPVNKLTAHIDDIPHVAISIFIFSDRKLLLQQRASSKYHSGGLWANTVCSHPRWQESAQDCASRRLQEELGWSVTLFDGDRIGYRAQVGELFENEFVHCFYGHLNTQAQDDHGIAPLIQQLNPIEVADLRWMTLPEIEQAIADDPAVFSAWFRIYLTQHKSKLERMMDAASLIA